MSSAARIDFEARLKAVDQLADARRRLSRRFREPLINASVVFLAAATEAFIEDLYEEAAALIYSGMTLGECQKLFKETSVTFHTASVTNTEFLYFHLGMEWTGVPNATLRSEWGAFLKARHQVAHGRDAISAPSRSKPMAKNARGFRASV